MHGRDQHRARAERVRELIKEHHDYRASCINLCSAENVTSRAVRDALASDLARRAYWESGAYAGVSYIGEIESMCVELAKELFRAEAALAFPMSGHVAVMATLWGVTTPGDTVLAAPFDTQGYPFPGFAEKSNLHVEFLAFDRQRWDLDADRCVEQVYQLRPRVVFLGASDFLFPHPVSAVSAAARETGSVVLYDGAHVLGLVAGGAFQDPLREGTDILFGSTNKTFPGPNKGLILFGATGREFYSSVHQTLISPPFLQSNHHIHHVAGLAIALCEMLAFGEEYARQVVNNAQALSRQLTKRGVKLLGERQGVTQSHQVLMDVEEGIGSAKAFELKDRLEEAGILADVVVRFGTQFVTRLGMTEAEMETIGNMIADVTQGARSPADVRSEARELASSYREVGFTFESGDDAYESLLSIAGSRQMPVASGLSR